VEEDTIPKPDGLGPVLQTADIEQNSIDFGPRSKEFEGCSIALELRVLENSKTCGAPAHQFGDGRWIQARPNLASQLGRSII
jgi:hypothetical protein